MLYFLPFMGLQGHLRSGVDRRRTGELRRRGGVERRSGEPTARRRRRSARARSPLSSLLRAPSHARA